MHNEKLIMEIQMDFEKGILNGIENLESMTSENLKQLLETEKENALEEVSGSLKSSAHLSNCEISLPNMFFCCPSTITSKYFCIFPIFLSID